MFPALSFCGQSCPKKQGYPTCIASKDSVTGVNTLRLGASRVKPVQVATMTYNWTGLDVVVVGLCQGLTRIPQAQGGSGTDYSIG